MIKKVDTIPGQGGKHTSPALLINKDIRSAGEIRCNCTDKEIAKSFVEDVEAVKDLLPRRKHKE